VRALLALLLIALPAMAQVRGVASVSVGDYSGLGFVSPFYGVGAALEYRAEAVELSVEGNWSPDRKFATRVLVPPFSPQYTVTGVAQGLARYGPALLGGGVDYSYTRSDGWDKTGWRWHVAGGLEFPIEANRLRVLVAHIEPMDDPSNDLRGERYSLRFDVPSGKVVFRPGVDVGFWKFHQSGNPDVRYSRRTWAIHLGIAR